MKYYWPGRLALVVCLSLAGCSTNVPDPQPQPRPDEPAPRLGEKIDFDVAAWLKLPRPQLAKLANEWAENVAKQREVIRTVPATVDLLPRVLPPFTVPGLNQATFSAKEGLSLPAYATPGKADRGLALHLARFGDHEAAGKWIDAGDEAMRKRLTALKSATNYPVEWTRLVGLVMLSSHLKLATGDVDGATQLVVIHKQLQKLLDAHAAAGPLGSALLPWGKKALVAAAEAWRKPSRNKVELADDIDKALAAWGDLPAPALALMPGATREEVETLLGSNVRGKAVFCTTAPAVARAIDVLALPLSGEGVQTVVAFLGADDRLVEVQVAYRPKIDTLYPTLADFAFCLVEHGFLSDKPETTGLQRQAFLRPGIRFEVTRTERSPAVGCLVRITAQKPGRAAASRSLSDLGEVCLDRAFETTRVRLARRQPGPTVTLKDADTLKRLAGPLDLPAPASAVLSRVAPPAPLIASLTMTWTSDDNALALERLLPPLWAAFGPGDLADDSEKGAGCLAFTWHDKDHRVQLRLPYDDHGPSLQAKNSVPADGLAERVKTVGANEQNDRQARLDAGKPDERLPRSPGNANERSFLGLKLGQDREATLAALPRGKAYRQTTEEKGVRVLFLTEPTELATFWVRQLQVRFDEHNKLAEIRLRYQPGPAAGKKGPTLRDSLTDAASGAPETLAPAWQGLWTDFPLGGKPITLRWQDDRTMWLYHEDAAGMELILRDRAAAEEALPRQWLPPGVASMRLGASQAEVEDKGRNPVLSQSNGAMVYRGPKASPFEMVLVWFAPAEGGGKAVRILAVHRDRPTAEPKEVALALNRLWGKQIDELGFLRRQAPGAGTMLGANFWHDDRVRIKTWAEITDGGPRLMTEWRTWPIEK